MSLSGYPLEAHRDLSHLYFSSIRNIVVLCLFKNNYLTMPIARNVPGHHTVPTRQYSLENMTRALVKLQTAKENPS